MENLKDYLGLTGKDVITGFSGVITCVCSYIGGCERLMIDHFVGEKGEKREGEWFDVSRIEIDKEKERITLSEDKVEQSPGLGKQAPVR